MVVHGCCLLWMMMMGEDRVVGAAAATAAVVAAVTAAASLHCLVRHRHGDCVVGREHGVVVVDVAAAAHTTAAAVFPAAAVRVLPEYSQARMTTAAHPTLPACSDCALQPCMNDPCQLASPLGHRL